MTTIAIIAVWIIGILAISYLINISARILYDMFFEKEGVSRLYRRHRSPVLRTYHIPPPKRKGKNNRRYLQKL